MMKLDPLAPPGELIDIGGYRLHLHCTGSGTPTVVLEAGAGEFSSAWSLVQPEVAHFTRVCSYDRAGAGWSDSAPASMPRTSDQVVRELHVLLHRAGIRPPLLLVGHSAGSFHIRLYASRFPQDVSGMVLVDPVHEDDWTARDPRGRLQALRVGTRRLRGYYLLSRLGLVQLFARFRQPEAIRKLPPHVQVAVRRLAHRPRTLQAAYREYDSLEESAAQVREQAGSLGDRPLVVLRPAGAAPPDQEAVETSGGPSRPAAADGQAAPVGLWTHGRVVVAQGSGRDILLDEPALVVEAIREVVAMVRAAAGPAPEQL
ncbi:MAG TPA: alpha/beta hydrolase [Longimicrobiaceae bacterium]|nr:alpha/beta hydrolase [Longimicrobiaceae bacterium]